jgi:hypothetical protein
LKIRGATVLGESTQPTFGGNWGQKIVAEVQTLFDALNRFLQITKWLAAAVELAERIGRQMWVLLLLRSAYEEETADPYEEETADQRILRLQLMLVRLKALT